MGDRDRDRDFAALALRLATGPMLIAHGYNKVFGKGGLEGTAGWFEGLGLQPGWLHARMAAATELGAGTLITLGALDPLPSAAVVGLMATATRTDHRGKGFFVFKGGWEYTVFVAAAATALASLGSGRWSVDRLIGRRPRRGAKVAILAAAFGVANSTALLAAAYRPAPDKGAGTGTTDAAAAADSGDATGDSGGSTATDAAAAAGGAAGGV
ncbi:MAG TPA: DoxX family protein [Acidimicrobiales bacterium]|nr:DoxX family protein [Acidimicrobiales bacterium]